MFRGLDDDDAEIVCDKLKAVIYPEKGYMIEQGEPLDLMLIITEGIAWTYKGGNNCAASSSWLGKGGFYGDKELREWTLNNNSLSNIPIATTNVKAHTNVEALLLMAKDLTDLFPCASHGSSISSDPRTIQIKVDG